MQSRVHAPRLFASIRARASGARARVITAVFFLCALPPALHAGAPDAPTNAPASERLIYERYGLEFICPPGWHILQKEMQEKKLFDLIRVYTDVERTGQNRHASLYEALEARAYMLVYERDGIGGSELLFTLQTANEINNQGYELITSKVTRENDVPLITYTFRYRMPEEANEREIWLSLRFFITSTHIFALYGSCRSEKELNSMITELFSGIRFHAR